MRPETAPAIRAHNTIWLNLAAAAAAGLAVVPWLRSFGPVTGEAGGLLAACGVTAVPGFLLLKASRGSGLSGRLRQALLLLAIATLLTSGGNFLRFLDALGVAFPAIPGISLTTTLLIWALGLCALFSLPLMPVDSGSVWRVATDILIAGVGMTLVVFVIWTLPGLRLAPPQMRQEIMAFNLMEAGNLVALNLILVRGALRPIRRAVWWLAVSAVIETVFLISFQYGIGRHAPDDRLANSLFFLDYMVYMLAADAFLSGTREGLETLLRPIRIWSVNPLPVVAVLGVGGLLIFSSLRDYQPAASLLAVGIVLMTLLLVARVMGSTYESLQILQRKAEEESRMQAEKLALMGRLSGKMALVVQTLVAGVRGHADLLPAEAVHDTQVLGSIEAIGEAARKASALAERLLLASGHRRGAHRPRNLADALRLQQAAVNRMVGEKRVMIWDLAKGDGKALVDPSDLETILKELVSNAGEATFHGGRITVRVRDEALTLPHSGISPSPPPGEYSVLEVSDTGRGFTQGTLPFVLEPFFTDKPAEQGRGLGLSVVHAIAARCGGGLLIETMPGTGSRVRVYLPLDQVGAGDQGAGI
jgi:signal transduction histidine kinase